jgi:hypothetical protein
MPARVAYDSSPAPLSGKGFSTELTLGPDAERTVAGLRLAAIQSGSDVTPELRAAIRDYVGALKQQGLQAEHAVILINRAMVEMRFDSDHSRPRLVDRIILHCIEEFYRRP